MYDELTEYLQGYICIDSIDEFTKSINEIGPYVSDLPIDTPLTVGEIKNFTRVDVRRSSYREFHIPKKSGGTRTITAPDGRLKDIMRTISFMLNNLYDAPEEAKAFIPGRSIVDNAKLHINKNYVLNIDLSDFFTSITAYMVERSLTDIGIPPVVSQTMASICTYPTIDKGKLMNVLPQGAPCSPVLSNICASKMDARLRGLAKRFGVTYSRYADDMTFSSNHNVYQEDSDFMMELAKIIEECKFNLNHQKTRLQKRGNRQEVTGITVSEKTNVSRKFTKNLRSDIHRLNYVAEPTFHEVNVIRGKLNYLSMVKGKDDSTYRKLLIKLNIALKDKHFIHNL